MGDGLPPGVRVAPMSMALRDKQPHLDPVLRCVGEGWRARGGVGGGGGGGGAGGHDVCQQRPTSATRRSWRLGSTLY